MAPTRSIQPSILRILCLSFVLAAGFEGETGAATDATEDVAVASSWQVSSSASRLTIFGAVRTVATQTLTVGPGAPPKNWKTLANLVLPRASLAFGQYVNFLQNGTAQGVFSSATGQVTLDLPLRLRDSSGQTQTLTAFLTTGQANGIDTDGSPICDGSSHDPSVCRGSPLDASRNLKLVAIVNIPQGGNTLGSGSVLYLELAGTLSMGCDALPCTASDGCHDPGTCNSSTGVCSNPVKPNGSSCSDANACTRTDTCQAGVCVGSNPVSCTASDACHDAGTCSAATGVCSNPAKPNGAACNDGNACTQTDTCQSGTCRGTNAVVCAASDTCHTAGTCNTGTGLCTNPVKANGTTCSDGSACTRTDTCQAGVCSGANPVVCSASDACHDVGTCNAGTGVCSNPAKTDGTPCADGNACTRTDTCQGGVCSGANPVVCSASDPCHNVGTCNTATGVCSNPAKSNGTSCSDGNACTRTDTCQAGTCTGASPVTCTASDACHTAGSCDTATGICSNPAKADGTSCSDGNACTRTDTCQAGVCSGANPVVCAASDQCHNVGACNTANGVCSNPAKPNGTACVDTNLCTQNDTCQAGACASGSAVVCTASDQCHNVGTCSSATGCSNPSKANGSACNDGNACTRTDVCQSGACTGTTPVVCAASNTCHTVGTCLPGSGLCTNPILPDGASCNDGNPCTQSDTCANGSCVGVPGDAPLEMDASVRVDRTGANSQIAWNPPAGASVSDVARGLLSGLPVGAASGEACLGSGFAVATTTDSNVPPLGEGYWYLIRGRSDCGTGSYGFQAIRGVPSTARTTGVCLGPCRTAADCGGVDSECATRVCSAGSCGFTNASAGTPVSAQTAGDCRRNVCDGSGGIASLVDDTDLADDANACTNDLCANGTPSHTFAAAGTACSLGSGAGVCSGTGSCAACGGTVQRCCASYPYCRTGLACQSGYCR